MYPRTASFRCPIKDAMKMYFSAPSFIAVPQLGRIRYQFGVVDVPADDRSFPAHGDYHARYAWRRQQTHPPQHTPVPHLRPTRVPGTLISPLFIVLFLSCRCHLIPWNRTGARLPPYSFRRDARRVGYKKRLSF